MPATPWATRFMRRGFSCAAGEDRWAPTASRKRCGPSIYALLEDLLKRGEADGKAKPEEFKRYGSARKLYNFNIDNASAY
jgi:hypothetical protein